MLHNGQPDLQTVVSFLTKRVQAPDADDYKKLAQAIKYIGKTMFLRRTAEANYLDQNHWFIDGAFAVHPDMKSHIRAYMTFGKGMVDGSAKTQKINTTSSTEPELVAVYGNIHACNHVNSILSRGARVSPHANQAPSRQHKHKAVEVEWAGVQ